MTAPDSGSSLQPQADGPSRLEDPTPIGAKSDDIQIGEVSIRAPAGCDARDADVADREGKASADMHLGEVVWSDRAPGSSASARPRSKGAPFLLRPWRAITSGLEWLFGLACLLLGLALLASAPVLQLLSFGYLLEVAGRVARQGRLRDGFVGIRKAARVGALVLHTWLMLLPLRLVSDLWYDAYLIDPQGAVTLGWRRAQLALTALTLGHMVIAWYCGGKARYFYWPLLFPWYVLRTLRGRMKLADWFPAARLWQGLRRGGLYAEVRDGVWDFVASLRLPYYFWLGVRGFVGAVAWLAVPVLLLIGSVELPPAAAALSGLAGGLLLAVVALHVPFLEAWFAAEGRWSALWEVGVVREQFRRAPLAYWLALVLTLALSIPLYVLQTFTLLPELRWLPALVFAASILPARLMAGWAVARANRRSSPRHVAFRWLARLSALPAAGFYVLVVYLSQHITWYGSWNMFVQPAFTLPAPFWVMP